MRYMPLFIDMQEREVLIIGGGRVALRRARQLSDAGASITVISPEICAEFSELADVKHIKRGAGPDDVAPGYFLVLLASSDTEVNAAIAEVCRKKGMLYNRCDSFKDGNFVNGSITTCGQIINSTFSGGVPAVSKYLQKKIAKVISPELAELARLLAELRPAIKASRVIAGADQDFIDSWVSDEVLEKLRDESIESLRQEILACL